MLEALGIDAVTETVYQAMLAHPSWGVAELAQHLGLPDAAVRVGLDQLAELELVLPSRETGGALRPVDPHAGLQALIAREREELSRRQQQIAAGQAAVAAMLAGISAGPPDHAGAERLVGLDAIQRRLEHFSRTAASEIAALVPSGAQSPAELDAGRPLDRGVLERGVAMRTVYLDAIRNDRATLVYAQWLIELGGEVRTSAVLPLRILIVDRVHALVPLTPADNTFGAMHLTAMGAVAVVAALFDTVWDSAAPLGSPPARDGEGLTDAERQLLRLLATGATDEIAARRLGVSLRTERRMLENLTERLGARSRFEAGVNAAKRGWL
ncbi:MAG TPA: helix-turn-helix transcriptional regulator [Actinocrinis sp.]|nr:helix-turn-helix transcriptional regulator [Actinocrinis sp.]